MRLLYIAFALCLIIACHNIGSSPIPQSPEALARTYCGSCHLYPEPGLLNKEKWAAVLPRMAQRMGLKNKLENPLARLNKAERLRVKNANIFPEQPVLADSLWQKIEAFYLQNAPDSLLLPSPTTLSDNSPFKSHFPELELGSSPFVIMAKFDQQDRLHLATWGGNFLELDHHFNIKKRAAFPRPIIDFQPMETGSIAALSIGDLYPNDKLFGAMAVLDTTNLSRPQLLFTNLARPVHFEQADFNDDGQMDFVICNYGNYVGQLAWYEKTKAGYQERIIKSVSGSTRVMVEDLDEDGDMDLVVLFAQGDEGISFFYNEQGRFRKERILRFQPLYGSNDFEWLDFDGDGDKDILLCNGDNGDHSNILKPYHGIRLFINDQNNFREQYFFPMHGAAKVRAADFDLDGDLDIIAASFFPDIHHGLDQSIIYLEQTANLQFKAHRIEQAAQGRWMVMDTGDIDQDGDTDVILGSFTLSTQGIDPEVLRRWRQQGKAVLFLENETN